MDLQLKHNLSASARQTLGEMGFKGPKSENGVSLFNLLNINQIKEDGNTSSLHNADKPQFPGVIKLPTFSAQKLSNDALSMAKMIELQSSSGNHPLPSNGFGQLKKTN